MKAGASIPTHTQFTKVANPILQWEYNIVDLLTQHIAYLNPSPYALLFNGGFWGYSFTAFDNLTFTQAFCGKALKLFKRVIWKSCNFRRGESTHLLDGSPIGWLDGSNPSLTQNALSTPGVEILNLSWTKNLNESDFVDALHFVPVIYNKINVQFLELLFSEAVSKKRR